MGTAFLMGQSGGGGGSIIKKVQTGYVDNDNFFSSGTDTTKDITIESINPDNSLVLIDLFFVPDAQAKYGSLAVDIIDSTTIRFYRNTATSLKYFLRWQVIEFNNVKSKQKGAAFASALGTSVTISPINPSKSIIASSSTNGSNGTTVSYFSAYSRIESNDSIVVTGHTSSAVYYQILEFN